jgi:hypothetical protein
VGRCDRRPSCANVSDLDAGANHRAHSVRNRESFCERRDAMEHRGSGPRLLRRARGHGRNRASRPVRPRHRHHHVRPGKLFRRDGDAYRPWRDGSGPSRDGAEGAGCAGREAPRADGYSCSPGRNHHAQLYPATNALACRSLERPTRDRFAPHRGHATSARISHAQRASLHIHRPRDRG